LNIFDRIFAGRVIKDYGPLQERNFGLGHIRTSLLLAERRGKLKLVFKFSGYFICVGSVQYCEIPIDKTDLLRRALEDADNISAAKFGKVKSAVHVQDFEDLA